MAGDRRYWLHKVKSGASVSVLKFGTAQATPTLRSLWHQLPHSCLVRVSLTWMNSGCTTPRTTQTVTLRPSTARLMPAPLRLVHPVGQRSATSLLLPCAPSRLLLPYPSATSAWLYFPRPLSRLGRVYPPRKWLPNRHSFRTQDKRFVHVREIRLPRLARLPRKSAKPCLCRGGIQSWLCKWRRRWSGGARPAAANLYPALCEIHTKPAKKLAEPNTNERHVFRSGENPQDPARMPRQKPPWLCSFSCAH